jgi:hypothetical protein
MHWAVRDANSTLHPVPAGLDPEVLEEWHHAINWLTCHDEAEWDDVKTDT